MLGTRDLNAMGEGDVLGRAEACAAMIREAEAAPLRLVCQWAILRRPGRLDPTSRTGTRRLPTGPP